MRIIKEGDLTHYKDIKVIKGALGDMETEWWTEKDWAKHRADIKKWTEDGTLGEVSYVNMTLKHNPIFDNPPGPAITSHSFTFLDFSNND